MKIYSGIIDAVRTMTAKEGVRSMYQGLWPTILQMGPYSGCQFALYKFLSEVYQQVFKDGKNASQGALFCGATSGVVAKTLVYPLDLTKKRLQVQEFNHHQRYKGYNDSSLIYKELLYNCYSTHNRQVIGLFDNNC